jgi:hypothetical protein
MLKTEKREITTEKLRTPTAWGEEPCGRRLRNVVGVDGPKPTVAINIDCFVGVG